MELYIYMHIHIKWHNQLLKQNTIEY
jgi:hypothetical protein